MLSLSLSEHNWLLPSYWLHSSYSLQPSYTGTVRPWCAVIKNSTTHVSFVHLCFIFLFLSVSILEHNLARRSNMLLDGKLLLGDGLSKEASPIRPSNWRLHCGQVWHSGLSKNQEDSNYTTMELSLYYS